LFASKDIAMEFVEYLAVGSMMNKTSITMRGIFPMESRAARLPGYKLLFGMANGFAAAEKVDGEEMHGVLHRITSKELAVLDKIEVMYIRELVEVVPYVGDEEYTPVQAYVYIFDPAKVVQNPDRFTDNPPAERYMDILKEGAKYFGLKKEFIEKKLENVQIIPRKSLQELRVFKVPNEELPEWTLKEMKDKDKEDIDVVYVGLQKKILRLNLKDLPNNSHTQILKRDRGTLWAYEIASKFMYDPKFGVPQTVEDMTDDHHRYVEDLILDSFISGELNNRWRIVALLKN